MRALLTAFGLCIFLIVFVHYISPSRAEQLKAVQEAYSRGYSQGKDEAKELLQQEFNRGNSHGAAVCRYEIEQDLRERGVGTFVDLPDGMKIFAFKQEFSPAHSENSRVAWDKSLKPVFLGPMTSDTLRLIQPWRFK